MRTFVPGTFAPICNETPSSGWMYDQKIRGQVLDRRVAENRQRSLLELDGSLVRLGRHLPVRKKGTPTQRQLSISSLRATYVSVWGGVNTSFASVGVHVFVLHYPFSILPSHAWMGRPAVPRLDGAEELALSRVPHWLQTGGWLHRCQGKQLEQVVGYHVSGAPALS